MNKYPSWLSITNSCSKYILNYYSLLLFLGLFLVPMLTLGIETSCDETACGIVDQDLKVLANRIYRQVEQHRLYGGVVPEIAARAHLQKITPVVASALKEAQVDISQVDLIAFTRGPGLIGPLLVGTSFARGLGKALHKPIMGISHLEGHLAAVYLSDKELAPPFVCLTVSGGHTELCLVKELFAYDVLGRTRDDAVGEAFDKCGKVLGLGYPAGPEVSILAKKGNRKYLHFPRGMDSKHNFEFSFSGVKTAFLRYTQSESPETLESKFPDICASLEAALVDILVKKTIRAMKKYRVEVGAVCGGVSANSYLREKFYEQAAKSGFKVIFPEMSLCTDNGAMIAGIAQMRFNHDRFLQDTEVAPSLSWPD